MCILVDFQDSEQTIYGAEINDESQADFDWEKSKNKFLKNKFNMADSKN